MHLGINETNSELDTRKIKTGFTSLMTDIGIKVVMNIIWRRLGLQETIVLRNMIKLASLASIGNLCKNYNGENRSNFQIISFMHVR